MKRLCSYSVLFAVCLLAAAACNDSPSSPREPASLSVSGTLQQDPAAGSSVSPAVLVRDAAGRPIGGVAVTFQVTAGGGSVSTATVTSNGSGVARLGAWVLGATPGVNTLVASVAGLPPVTFTLTTCGAYCISIRFVGAVSAAHEAAFTNARLRWQQVITGDLPPVALDIPALACEDAEGEAPVQHPAIDEVIDDLLIYVQVDDIDGQGATLASAGPCFIRSTSRLPVFSVMLFDEADLDGMSTGLLLDVITHELGHALGFSPTIWDQFDLVQDTGTVNVSFTGNAAATAFTQAGGTLINGTGVPLENTGGPATIGSHWREAVLSNELMTGFLSATGGSNPLSAITIGSLQDTGYQVNFAAADAYTVPGGGPMRGLSGPQLEIVERRLAAPRAVP